MRVPDATRGLKFPFREQVHACIHPESFKYFIDPDLVEEMWEHLLARFGEVRRNPSFGTIEIESDGLFLRATAARNPITVIRKTNRSRHDLEAFHTLIGFENDHEQDPE